MEHKLISRGLALVVILLALALPPAARSQEPTPAQPLNAIAASAVRLANAQVTANISAAPGKTTTRGLDSPLAQIAAASQAGDAGALAPFRGTDNVDLQRGQARVIVEMDASPNAVPVGAATSENVVVPTGKGAQIQHAPAMAIRSDLAQTIAATGATFETAYQNSVQVLAPLSSLEALANMPGVHSVRLPYPSTQAVLPPQAHNAALPQTDVHNSQGIDLTNDMTWQSAGYDGTGISVAVFDFGFTGWAALESNGHLPSDAVLKDFSSSYSFNPDAAGYGHGAACGEIAWDMAPGAKLYLYAFDTDIELASAVTDYINNVSGKKVATMSIGYVNAGPYDGTGSINTIINNAQAAGIFWANSAGNSQKEHWSGTAVQSGSGNSIVFGSGNVEGIGPTPGNLWNVPGGTQLQIFLEWNDWNSARNGNQNHVDYDMYLLYWNGSTWNTVSSSLGNQCDYSSEPTEAIYYNVPSGSANYYGLQIVRYTAANCPNTFGHWMQLFTFNGFYQSGTGAANSFWYVNQGNSIAIPADGNSALAVGATFWSEDGSNPTYGLETFSSLGPRNAAGGGNPGTAINKPDLVAPDGVSNYTYGINLGTNYANGGAGFWGTSAAAPHLAGLAAATWSRLSVYSLANLVSYIKGQAISRAGGSGCEGSSPNNRYGVGRINLGAVPGPAVPSTHFMPYVVKH